MPTTGAVLYFKPRAAVTVKAKRSTTASIYASVRFLSGLYSVTGVSESNNLRGRRQWIPHRGQRWMNSDGTPTDEFFAFVDFLANTMIGGPTGSTLPDVATTAVATQAQASTVAAVVTGVQQQVSQNAEVLAATVESAQSGALPGATQIPPVQRTNQLER